MYTIWHLDPKPGAKWKPIEERYLRNAIGALFSPWPEHRMDEREERISQEIAHLARTGDIFTHTSRDKYKVVLTQPLHSPICEMTQMQFTAWLRALADAFDRQGDDGRSYELSEWLLVMYDTPTHKPTACSTMENHE